MNRAHQIIAQAIDTAPLNRGLKGADWLAFDGEHSHRVGRGRRHAFRLSEGDGIYEIHVLYVSRGREAINQASKRSGSMFEEHGAT
jgi:hypothetical protein